MDILKVNNLTIGPFKKFTLSFPTNSFSVIAGSNMSGKTLLIKVLSGLIDTSSKVLYNDKAVSSYDYNIINQDIVFISNVFHFSFDKVLEEVRYQLEALGEENDVIVKTVRGISKDLEIEKILKLSPFKLNYYDKLKVVLARWICAKPKVLLFDDPCKYLKRKEREEFISILNQLQTIGLTIIMTTSNLEDVIYTVNSKLFILNDGKIVSSGKTMDVLSNDSLLNKSGLELPFMIDLCVKLKYYNLVDKIDLNALGVVNILWK